MRRGNNHTPRPGLATPDGGEKETEDQKEIWTQREAGGSKNWINVNGDNAKRNDTSEDGLKKERLKPRPNLPGLDFKFILFPILISKAYKPDHLAWNQNQKLILHDGLI